MKLFKLTPTKQGLSEGFWLNSSGKTMYKQFIIAAEDEQEARDIADINGGAENVSIRNASCIDGVYIEGELIEYKPWLDKDYTKAEDLLLGNSAITLKGESSIVAVEAC